MTNDIDARHATTGAGRRRSHLIRYLVTAAIVAVTLFAAVAPTEPASASSGDRAPAAATPAAQIGESFAGLWTISGGSGQNCVFNGGCQSWPTTGVIRLAGACDDAGPCEMELMSGLTTPGTAQPITTACASRATTGYAYPIGPPSSFALSFAATPAEAGSFTMLRAWTDDPSTTGAVQVNGATATRTAGPGGYETTSCVRGVSPDQPTNAVAVAGEASATVSWSAPSFNPGVVSYRAKSWPENKTCTALAPEMSCTVEGLTNGTEYTFSVIAYFSAEMYSPPSMPSAPVTPPGGTTEPTFGDVPADHPFSTQIEWMVSEGIAGGYNDGTFRPAGNVTRQAMASFLYKAAGSPAFTPPATSSFSDVPTNHTFFKQIEWMVHEGISGGYPDGTFRPTGTVTRQAAASFHYKEAGSPPFTPPATATFSDVPTNHTFFKQIEWMVSEGIAGGYPDGTFRPSGAVTRQASASFLYNANH